MTDNGLAALAAAVSHACTEIDGEGVYTGTGRWVSAEDFAAAILAGGAVFLPDGLRAYAIREADYLDTIATLRAALATAKEAGK